MEWIDPVFALIEHDRRWLAHIAELEQRRQTFDRTAAPWRIPGELALHGATEEALDAAERTLGTRLPPSYRRFLARFDGSDPESTRSRLLSLAEVVALATGDAPYRPWTGRAERAGADDGYYADKPAHHLFVYQHAMGSDGRCLDLRGDAEPVVVWWDPELVEWDGDVPTLSGEALPRFDILLQDHVFSVVEGALEDGTKEAVMDLLRAHGDGKLPWEH